MGFDIEKGRRPRHVQGTQQMPIEGVFLTEMIENDPDGYVISNKTALQHLDNTKDKGEDELNTLIVAIAQLSKLDPEEVRRMYQEHLREQQNLDNQTNR